MARDLFTALLFIFCQVLFFFLSFILQRSRTRRLLCSHTLRVKKPSTHAALSRSPKIQESISDANAIQGPSKYSLVLVSRLRCNFCRALCQKRYRFSRQLFSVRDIFRLLEIVLLLRPYFSPSCIPIMFMDSLKHQTNQRIRKGGEKKSLLGREHIF